MLTQQMTTPSHQNSNSKNLRSTINQVVKKEPQGKAFLLLKCLWTTLQNSLSSSNNNTLRRWTESLHNKAIECLLLAGEVRHRRTIYLRRMVSACLVGSRSRVIQNKVFINSILRQTHIANHKIYLIYHIRAAEVHRDLTNLEASNLRNL